MYIKLSSLLLAATLVWPAGAAFAQQGHTSGTVAPSAVLEGKTPITSSPDHSLDDFVGFAMACANAKADSLKESDPVASKEWHDYFIKSVSANAIPPGVLAFSHKLKALTEAAMTNPHIVLANITGEQVVDVVFKNYQQHIQQTSPSGSQTQH